MPYQHKNLANGQWFELSILEQLANIGTEVNRALKWKNKNNPTYSENSFMRALELLSLSLDDPKNKGAKLKELCRLYEVLGDYFVGDNEYKSSPENLEKYFYPFNYAVRMQQKV